MEGRLGGKVALVSGAARGMGEQHGRLLAKEGASVVLGDILEPEVAAVAEGIRAEGGAAEHVYLDVTESSWWVAAV